MLIGGRRENSAPFGLASHPQRPTVLGHVPRSPRISKWIHVRTGSGSRPSCPAAAWHCGSPVAARCGSRRRCSPPIDADHGILLDPQVEGVANRTLLVAQVLVGQVGIEGLFQPRGVDEFHAPLSTCGRLVGDHDRVAAMFDMDTGAGRGVPSGWFSKSSWISSGGGGGAISSGG